MLQPGPQRPVVRIGDTIRRQAGWWTPAVHHLLAHLHDVGFPYAPTPLGLDDDGREVLSYIEGDSGRACRDRVIPDAGLRAYARLLRAYHDAIVEYRPPRGTEWAYGPMPMGEGDIVCHGDFGSWNLVWRGAEPVGIVDWDLAYPGPPSDDVAYALLYSVPFRSDDDAMRHFGFSTPPDRAHRIKVFADAYGMDADGLVGTAIERQHLYARQIRQLHDRGLVAPWTDTASMLANERAASWSEANRHLFE